jgi:hypothetical protein
MAEAKGPDAADLHTRDAWGYAGTYGIDGASRRHNALVA